MTAFQQLQQVMKAAMGDNAMQGLFHGGGNAALAAVSKDAVAPPCAGRSLLTTLAANASRRCEQHSGLKLQHVFVNLVEMDGTPNTVFLGQAVPGNASIYGKGLLPHIHHHLTTAMGRLL